MKHRNLIITLGLTAAVMVLGGLFQAGCAGPADSRLEIEVYTEPVAEGDPAPQQLRFPSFERPRLLWITGFRAELVNQDGSPAVAGPAYRASIGFDYMRHARIHQLPVYHTDRLFTLTPQQTGVSFPEGFGLPFYSDETLTLTTKLLGSSQPSDTAGVRQRTVLEFVFEQDLDEPLKPLFATSGRWVQSSDGGREQILRLPYDTHAHYITAPLRPHADSVELRDLSTGETAYDSARDAGDEATKTEGVSYFSGADGVALLKERSYLLVNHDDEAAMEEPDTTSAVLLYLRDKQYKKLPREPAPVAHFEEPIKIADERLILITNHGKIEIAFYPEVAPRHYKQIVKLARLGVYDGVQFHRVEPDFLVQLGFPESRLGSPLTAEQAAALRRLEAELSDLPMKRWTVAMALRDNGDPDSAVASFFMLLKETRRIDQTFTIVGRVISGLGTLNSITRVPLKDGTPVEPVFIEKAEVKTIEEIEAGRQGRLKRSGQAKGK